MTPETKAKFASSSVHSHGRSQAQYTPLPLRLNLWTCEKQAPETKWKNHSLTKNCATHLKIISLIKTDVLPGRSTSSQPNLINKQGKVSRMPITRKVFRHKTNLRRGKECWAQTRITGSFLARGHFVCIVNVKKEGFPSFEWVTKRKTTPTWWHFCFDSSPSKQFFSSKVSYQLSVDFFHFPLVASNFSHHLRPVGRRSFPHLHLHFPDLEKTRTLSQRKGRAPSPSCDHVVDLPSCDNVIPIRVGVGVGSRIREVRGRRGVPHDDDDTYITPQGPCLQPRSA